MSNGPLLDSYFYALAFTSSLLLLSFEEGMGSEIIT
jgi:hypothetical protein